MFADTLRHSINPTLTTLGCREKLGASCLRVVVGRTLYS